MMIMPSVTMKRSVNNDNRRSTSLFKKNNSNGGGEVICFSTLDVAIARFVKAAFIFSFSLVLFSLSLAFKNFFLTAR